jgi:L-lactate dehydrogenase complex protein LldF
MPNNRKNFAAKSAKIVYDLNHRRTIRFNMSKYEAAVGKGKERYADLQAAKRQASTIKRIAVSNLADLLEQFEKNFEANGGTVLWAKSAKEANSYIADIAKENKARLIVKSKSMATEEIDLNLYAEKNGLQSIETDLGEYIVQLAGEKPYHIVTPAMHKSKSDIAKLFNEKFGLDINSSAEEMTMLARKNLRSLFAAADIGITGANFIIPDIGAISLTENEGNAIMSTGFPKIHIAIAGIEKVASSLRDLALLWPHLSSHGTGQALTVYNSILRGPRADSEPNGPDKMYVILLDNGRTDLYSSPFARVALSCIRCGSCLNACPVYRNIGGYTYNTTYQGPIGSVISPHLSGFKDFGHLSSACTLCGRCTEVCPVEIPLHDILLKNRNEMAANFSQASENAVIAGFARIMSNRKYLDMLPGKIKSAMLRIFMSKAWGKGREMPQVANKSFAQLYKNKK